MEAMSVESIIEAYWITQNHWTKVRFPYFVSHRSTDGKNSGGWSDVDVVAFNSKNNELVLCESKAHGNSASIKTLKSLIKDTQKFREAIPLILKDPFIKSTSASSLTIHIVANIKKNDEFEFQYKNGKFFKGENTPQEMAKYEILLKQLINNSDFNKKSFICVKIKVDSLFTVFSNIIGCLVTPDQEEKKNIKKFEKRFGNVTLDIAREINRYLGFEKNKTNIASYKTQSDNFKMFFEKLNVNPLVLCKYFLDPINGSQSEKDLEILLQKVSNEKFKLIKVDL